MLKVSVFRCVKDCRLNGASPDANYGASTSGSLPHLRVFDLSNPHSGDPVVAGSTLFADDGSNHTEFRFNKVGSLGTHTHTIARLLQDFVEGGGDGNGNSGLLGPPDLSGASWNHYSYGASPQAWNTAGGQGQGSDIEPAKDHLTFVKNATNEIFTVRDTGGGGIECAGLLAWLQLSVDLGIVQFRHSATGSHQLSLRGHANPPELQLIHEPPIAGAASSRSITHAIGIRI